MKIPVTPPNLSLFMRLKESAIILILLMPVILPPYMQYKQIISAPAALGLIIAAYLPLWLYLNYSKEVKDMIENFL